MKNQNKILVSLALAIVISTSMFAISKPIPGVGIVVKRNPGSGSITVNTGAGGTFSSQLPAGEYLISLPEEQLKTAVAGAISRSQPSSDYKFDGTGIELSLDKSDIQLNGKPNVGGAFSISKESNPIAITVPKGGAVFSGTLNWDDAVMNKTPDNTNNQNARTEGKLKGKLSTTGDKDMLSKETPDNMNNQNARTEGKTKGKIVKPGNNGMISIGGGTNTGGTSTGLLRFDASIYVPFYSNEFMSVGFNAGGNYNSFNNVFKALPTVYNMANQVTNTAVFVGDVAAKSSGFTLQVGPQANFHVGNHLIISPIVGFGLSNMYQPREYKAVQTTAVDIKTYSYDLLKVKQTPTSGLCMTPKVRLNYMISPTVGFWTEGSYLISPSVSTQISTFKPEGAANSKGYYEERQLALGTYTTQTLTQSYNAVGVNAGITIVFGGGNSERKGWDGTVKGGNIQQKGITQSGIKRTEETSVERKGWDGSVKGIAERKGINEKGLKKTESIAADPKGWDGSVKGGLAGGSGGGAAAASYASTGMIVNDGIDNDCDGITSTKINDQIILIKGIDVNGIPFEHAINTKGTGGTIARTTQNSDNGNTSKHAINSKGSGGNFVKTQNPENNVIPVDGAINTKGTGAVNGRMNNGSPLYVGNTNEGQNPMQESQRNIPPSCGSVTQKITYPDGTVEENTFACPADAANYRLQTNGNSMPNRISMNVTVPKQTQGATFGEKVNQGLHATGGALGQGASLLGGALPGGSVISAATVVENGNSGEQPSSISNVLKTKHDTAKNSVGNIRRVTQTPDSIATDSTTSRKGWDGTVKGGNRGIDKADIRKNAVTQRTGSKELMEKIDKPIKKN